MVGYFIRSVKFTLAAWLHFMKILTALCSRLRQKVKRQSKVHVFPRRHRGVGVWPVLRAGISV